MACFWTASSHLPELMPSYQTSATTADHQIRQLIDKVKHRAQAPPKHGCNRMGIEHSSPQMEIVALPQRAHRNSPDAVYCAAPYLLCVHVKESTARCLMLYTGCTICFVQKEHICMLPGCKIGFAQGCCVDYSLLPLQEKWCIRTQGPTRQN